MRPNLQGGMTFFSLRREVRNGLTVRRLHPIRLLTNDYD